MYLYTTYVKAIFFLILSFVGDKEYYLAIHLGALLICCVNLKYKYIFGTQNKHLVASLYILMFFIANNIVMLVGKTLFFVLDVGTAFLSVFCTSCIEKRYDPYFYVFKIKIHIINIEDQF